MSHPLALVLGSGITPLGVMRCLGPEGILVWQVSQAPQVERYSRYVQRHLSGPENASSAEQLERFLSELTLHRAVLFPCADNWNETVAALPDDLKERYPCSQPASSVQAVLVDKQRLAALLSSLGIPHPKTIPLDQLADLEQPDATGLENGFLKPVDSLSFFARFGVKGIIVKSATELRQQWQAVTQQGFRMTLQQYVPGPASHHHFVDGFVDRHGRWCGVMARQRLRMYPPDFGNSTYMVSEPLEAVEPCLSALRKLFAEVTYRGLFSAEFKRDDRDGEFKLLEINVRPWWYIGFTAMCGMPLALMAYRDALEEKVEPVTTYVHGVCLMYPYYDYYSCKQLLRSGELSTTAWIRSWLVARHAVFTWRDPYPSVVGLFGGLWRKVTRIKSRLLSAT